MPPSCALSGGFAIVHGLHCYGNTIVAETSSNPSGPPHALRMLAACGVRRRLPSPALKSTCLLRAPFHFVHTAGVLKRERKMFCA